MHKHISGPAKIDYRDGEYIVLSPGNYVVCAVTGVQIPLEELRYWSVELQEAYATSEAVLKRYQTVLRKS